MAQKMNFTNNQTAFEYAIYEMVGSCFNKTTCCSPLIETKMRVQFCEQKLDKQYSYEDKCISYIEKELMKSLPEEVWNQDVRVRLLPDSKDNLTEIAFEGDNYILSLKGVFKGPKSTITHELWAR